ncbi:hypothetical protein [Archaeoglobus sp.]
MISFLRFRKRTTPKRCIYCRAFKPVPDSEHIGYCAYWKRMTVANDCCHKFEPAR